MRQGQELANRPTSYYGGPLTVGPTDSETAAWNARAGYNSGVFGGQPLPQYGDLTRAVSGQLNGGTQLAGMAGSVSPYATSALTSGFGQTNTSGIAGIQAPGQTNAAGQIGQYGFGTSLDPNSKGPTFGTAGGLDARGAYASALQGTPDYQGVQGAIEAANAPLMRQFQDEFIPQLNQRATFTNNATGGIKSMNRALPELGQRMSENALSITEGERQRALGAQERAANAVTQGGFQGYGLGLSTAQGERGLEQGLANLGLNADQTRAGLMQGDFNTGLQGAGLGLQREGMIADQSNQYRSDLLGLGSLGGNLAQGAGSQQLSAAGMFPGVYNLGRQPGDDALSYAGYDRGLQEDALAADQQRFDYMRDQPYNQAGWYQNLLSGISSPYGVQTGTQPGGSRAAGALGGAMSGAMLGNMLFPGVGGIAGGGLGLLAGLF